MHMTLTSPPRKTNFPAFPFPGFAGGAGLTPQPSNSGMSFRDYVAVRAMQSLAEKLGAGQPEWVASQSYRLADEMVKAREV